MTHRLRSGWCLGMLGGALAMGGCATSTRTPPPQAFSPAMLFPADASLDRPEAGVALPDGRLIVSDQVFGLRLVEVDGTSRPFGRMRDCGTDMVRPFTRRRRTA